MASKSLRNALITIFVIVWTIVFHYESTRYFYLEPFVRKNFPNAFKEGLPKLKFLFPPAGWIMFYNVDDRYGYAEIYGIKGSEIHPLDPHQFIRTRNIGFDNIHRGILSSVLDKRNAQRFCNYLQYKIPYYDRFVVTSVIHPSITKEPYKRIQNVEYQCIANNEAPQ